MNSSAGDHVLEDINLPAEELNICIVDAFLLLLANILSDFKYLFRKPAGKDVSIIKDLFLFKGNCKFGFF